VPIYVRRHVLTPVLREQLVYHQKAKPLPTGGFARLAGGVLKLASLGLELSPGRE